MKLNFKKGINAIVMTVATLGLTAITIGIYAIVVQAFRDSQTDYTLAWNASNDGLKLFSGLTSQFNTIGQVSGVLILFGVMALFGIGGYMAYQKYGPGGAA